MIVTPNEARLVLADAGRIDQVTAAWPGVPLSRPGAWTYFHHADLPALARALSARLPGRSPAGAPQSPLAPEEPYPGFRRLLVADPDGYQVVFWETLPLSDAEILGLYSTGPARLAAALDGLTDAALDRPWQPGKWTLREIVHHLADAETGVLPALHLALADPGRQMHPNHWDAESVARALESQRRPVQPAVDLIRAIRAWVLGLVAQLPDALDRHIEWPGGRREPVRELLRHLGGHARHHIGQVEASRSSLWLD